MNGWNIAGGLACLWLTACSPQNELEAHFQTYLKRVAHVLEVTAPTLSPAAALPPLPPQRTLQQAQPRIHSGLLDALKLRQCRLLELVAEHNGPVGKSQTAALQLLYHLQFQQGMRRCLTDTDDPALADWLRHIAAQKAPLLPGYHWNMMVSEPDIRAALSPRQRPLKFEQQSGYQETIAAFELFAQLHDLAGNSQGDAPLTPRELNQALGGLYHNDYLGRLFYSLHSAAHYLGMSLAFLQQLEGFDCRRGGKVQAERLRNAMQHYYIEGIQRYFSQIDRQFVQLAPLLQHTLTPPPDRQELMHEYREQVGLGLNSRLYRRYRTLTLEHARLWQRFLRRCDISPT
ncbi:DUF3080 family protein [Oceanisphaera psychrotolerans]|uniref:DUF3080 domain-containing protein n=1 Tax=Oceanisphaera psychrotolerans TaxID=1414654 RepID=A0A1J4Q9X8_9GAMM|nr:DUF3080 family protein [Oceanisphaera psychrotolerans]OIN04294.1 hypothetical protein BFR47_06740 [Oceanisphaera psychrotolerans]